MRRGEGESRFWPALGLVAAGLVIGTVFDLGERVEAASPDAWDEFRSALTDKCINAAALGTPYVRIDPFGTQNYGIARITSTTNNAWQTVVCVARKTPEGLVDVEISAPLEEWTGTEGN